MEHLLCVFLLTSLMTSAFVDTEVVNVNVTKTVGQDCVLRCERPEGGVVELLEWTQTETESQSKKLLLLYRNGTIQSGQHAQFKGRVQLQDPDLKSVNLGVNFKNVRLEDSGDYRCVAKVKTTTAGRHKRNTGPVFAHIHLFVSESPKDKSVNDPPLTERNTAAAVGVPVFIIFVLLGAGAVFWKRKEIKQWQASKWSPVQC